MQITSPLSTLVPTSSALVKLPSPTPSHLPPIESETTDTSVQATPFFFVLSASSPLTPSDSETGLTPISPFKGDIPEALSYLLPQPSNSLLEVINVTQSARSPMHQSLEYQHPPSTPHPEGSSDPSSSPRTRSGSNTSGSMSKRRPSMLHFRDSTAAVPISQAFIEQPNPPASSVAEVAPVPPLLSLLADQPSRQRDQIVVYDTQSRITYPSASSSPHSASPLRPRPREARSMEVRSPTARQPQTAGGHIRGRSSPFPLPIQFSFAPSSIPGSATTPYSYF